MAEPDTVELHERRAWAPDGRSASLAEIALDALHAGDQEQIMGAAPGLSGNGRALAAITSARLCAKAT